MDPSSALSSRQSFDLVTALMTLQEGVEEQQAHRPPQLWTTLWATGLRASASRANSGFASDCLKVRQRKSLENQILA